MPVKELIDQLKLLPHPEGGYYKETYKSRETIPGAALPARFNANRSFSTAIYFLLEQGNFSAFHKIESDECWHFYSGDTLLIYVIHLDGTPEIIRLGNNLIMGDVFQAVVPAGCWFASEPAYGTAYALAGCTVAPGFDFEDFVLAEMESLSNVYPQHRLLIKRLCR